MKESLSEVNELQSAGFIGRWAIGGAMGATFYLEPVSTYDLDIFVIFEGAPLILTLTPIYDFLQSRGHKAEGYAMLLHGWPVQFLPAESSLLREAVEQAREVDFEGVSAWVMTPEHLMAIALQTGRGKDYARLLAFVESQAADNQKLHEILKRHGLTAAWEKFRRNFLNSL